jgi:hypothetical protein
VGSWGKETGKLGRFMESVSPRGRWKYGNEEMWKYGNMKMRECGNEEMF